ncbi:MAG: hypothetical protein PVG74_05335, partial [Desulfobacterales bacterium]
MKLRHKISKGLIVITLMICWNTPIFAGESELRQSDIMEGIALSSEEAVNGSLLLLEIDIHKLDPPVREIQLQFK